MAFVIFWFAWAAVVALMFTFDRSPGREAVEAALLRSS